MVKSLTLQFIPYDEIERLNSGERIKRLLKIVLDNKIILLQGRLRPEEETRLIEDTMVLVGTLKNFKGIELAVIKPKNNDAFETMKKKVASFLVGERDSMTIIGPASIIKEIRRDPKRIQLLIRKIK